MVIQYLEKRKDEIRKELNKGNGNKSLLAELKELNNSINWLKQIENLKIKSIVEILNLVDRASEKQIIEALEADDPELVGELKKWMFVFEDIVMLDDTSVQKVLREVDILDLVKALKSVHSEVQNKIFRNMSERSGQMIKEDMEFMGPVRLKDVEEAQQKIGLIIRKLEESGEIIVPRCSGEDELVV